MKSFFEALQHSAMNELVEIAYIMTLPEAIPASGVNDFARSDMDRYRAGLTLTDPGGSEHR